MIFELYLILTNSFSHTTETTMQFLYPVKQFLNIQNYYYWVVAITFFGTFAMISGFVAFDTIFVIFIQHACGMFAILIERLKNINGDNAIFLKHNNNKNQDKNCKILIECLAVHEIIIEFTDLVNSTFSLGLLISTILNSILLSFTSFCAREYRHNPTIMTRYIILTVVEIFHLFNKFWQCQTLIDHSILFRNSIYDSNWYKVSPKTKKVLYIMLIRSKKLCTITAGKFFEMSFHTFGKILKTAASYFTVLVTIKKV
ncbi:odorant receptor 9a-like [Leptopilina boulardi]|uniref:odorant receptor 9a-like n=1 Tax=Leptopilina boulardi TaxID=63433 RepID=UPI0021F5301D|nr:odorant receptor 9a-like [Leptopilina boulardi]